MFINITCTSIKYAANSMFYLLAAGNFKLKQKIIVNYHTFLECFTYNILVVSACYG